VVRYIHLNPVRARLVADVTALASHPWTGHAVLMGRRRADFLDAGAVLCHFGDDTAVARRGLARWMQEGLTQEEPEPGFEDGQGGLPAEAPGQRVERELDGSLERDLDRGRLRDAGWDVERVLVAVCRRLGVEPGLLRAGRRTPGVSEAREAVAGLAVGAVGESQESVAQATGVSRQAVAQALGRFAVWPRRRREEMLALVVLGLRGR
jgi:hypothetical protein